MPFKNTVQITDLSAESDAFERIEISEGIIAILEADPTPGKSDYTDFILSRKRIGENEESPLVRRKQKLVTPDRQVRSGSSKEGMTPKRTDSDHKQSAVLGSVENPLYPRKDLTPVPSCCGQRGSASRPRGRPRIHHFDDAVMKRKRGLSLDRQKMGIDFTKKPRSAITEVENTSSVAKVMTESENLTPLATVNTHLKSKVSTVAAVTQVERSTSLDKDDLTPITSDNSKGYRTVARRENGTSKGKKTRKGINSPKETKSKSHVKRILADVIVHMPQEVCVATPKGRDQQDYPLLAVQDKNVSDTDTSREEIRRIGSTASGGFSGLSSSNTGASSQGLCIRESSNKEERLNYKDNDKFPLKEKDESSISRHENSMCSDSSFEIDQAPPVHDDNSPTSSTESCKTDLNTPPKGRGRPRKSESKIKERKLATAKKSRMRKKLTKGKTPKTGKEASSTLERQAEGIKRMIGKFLKNKNASKNATYKSGETFTVRGYNALGMSSNSRFALRSEPPENTAASKSCGEKQGAAAAGTPSEVKKGSVIISPPSNLVTFTSMNSVQLSNVVHDGIRELVGKGHSHIYVLVEPPEKGVTVKDSSSEKLTFRVNTRSYPFELIPVKTPKASVTQLAASARESCDAVEESVHPGWDSQLKQVPLPGQSSKLTSESLAARKSKHTFPCDEANVETGRAASDNGKAFSNQAETSSCVTSVGEELDVIENQNVPVKPSECSILSKSSLRNAGFLSDSTIQISTSEPKNAGIIDFSKSKEPGACTSLPQEPVNTSCLMSSTVASTNEMVTTVSSLVATSTVHEMEIYTTDPSGDHSSQSLKELSSDRDNETLTSPSMDMDSQSQIGPSIGINSQSQTIPSLATSSQSQKGPSVETSNQSEKVCALDISNKSQTLPSLDTSNHSESSPSLNTNNQSGRILALETSRQTEAVLPQDESIRTQTAPSLDRRSKTEADSLVDISNKTQQTVHLLNTCSQAQMLPSLETSDQLYTVDSLNTSNQSQTVPLLEKGNQIHVVLNGASENSANSTPKVASPPVPPHACSAKSKSSSAQSSNQADTAVPKTSLAMSLAKNSKNFVSAVTPTTSVMCTKMSVEQKQSVLASTPYQAILPRSMILLNSVDANTSAFVFSANGELLPTLTKARSANASQTDLVPISLKTIFKPWQPLGFRKLLPKPTETCEKVQHDTGPVPVQSTPESTINKSTPGAVLSRLFKRSSGSRKSGAKSPQGRKTSVFKRSPRRKSNARASKSRTTAPHVESPVVNLLPSLSDICSAQIARSPALPTGGNVKRNDAGEINARSTPAVCDTRRRNSLSDGTRKDGGEDSVTSTDSDSFDASLALWTCSDVARYLSHHGLGKLIPGFQNVDGLCMVEMVRWYITSSDVLSKYLYDLGCSLQENLKMCSLLTSLRSRTSLDQPASSSALSPDS